MDRKLTAEEAKQARESVGASQIEIAHAVGINRTYYSLFEAGRYVLDDAEQARLLDALTDRGYEPGADGDVSDDYDEDDDTEITSASESAPVSTVAAASSLPPEQLALERSKAALASIRDAVPRGLQSIRVAAAVETALSALAGLDYIDLLQLAAVSGIPTDGLIAPGEFAQLELAGMQQWEARAAGVLICSTLYGKAWNGACFGQLKELESELRAVLDGQSLEYRERGFLDQLFGDGESHCPNRRADLAPYVVRAAIQRKAPALVTSEPNTPQPNDRAA